jgi:tetrahydromethanopterin S-methyltransferase subunit D
MSSVGGGDHIFSLLAGIGVSNSVLPDGAFLTGIRGSTVPTQFEFNAMSYALPVVNIVGPVTAYVMIRVTGNAGTFTYNTETLMYSVNY